jgi:hypothetical protein
MGCAEMEERGLADRSPPPPTPKDSVCSARPFCHGELPTTHNLTVVIIPICIHASALILQLALAWEKYQKTKAEGVVALSWRTTVFGRLPLICTWRWCGHHPCRMSTTFYDGGWWVTAESAATVPAPPSRTLLSARPERDKLGGLPTLGSYAPFRAWGVLFCFVLLFLDVRPDRHAAGWCSRPAMFVSPAESDAPPEPAVKMSGGAAGGICGSAAG